LLEFLFEGAAGVFFDGERFVDDSYDFSIRAKFGGFLVDFGEAACFKVLKVRLEFGGLAGASAAVLA